MIKELVEFLKISPTDTDEIRKQKILNMILIGLTFGDILIIIISLSFVLIGIDIGDIEGVIPLYIAALFFLLIPISIFFINKFISRIIASHIFLIALILFIILVNTPHQLIEGRNLLYVFLPIFLAGILLKPYYSFVISIIMSIIIAIIGFNHNITANIPAIILFIFIGFFIWLSTNSIEKSLMQSREAYNRANFYKDIFSHDINNILQNVLSSSQLLSQYINDPQKRDESRKIIEILSNQVSRGTLLVSNIRKLTEIEEEKIILIPTDAIIALNSAFEFVKKSYPNKNIDILIKSSFNKISVKANELLVGVFENILINAIKHNKNPNIEILVNISKEELNQINFFKWEFIDNAMGIINEKKKLIFLRDSKSRNNQGGLGLGLSLVKKIIEKYNGKIWVEDKVKGDYSQGSIFMVLIPEMT